MTQLEVHHPVTPKPGVIGAPHQASAILTSYIAPMPLRKCLLAVAMLGVIFTSSLLASSSPPAVAAVPPQPSFGCGSGASPVQGQQSFDFSAAGEVGSYIVEMQTDASAKVPLPLIIDLHGYSETAAIQASFSALGSYGSTHGFITVTPQVNKAVQYWNITPGSADQKFLGDLITHLTQTLCIDSHRVFVAGYSNGAFMASALACTYANKIAAVATVAGIQAPPGCHPTRPVPVVAFHGTADPFVPYQGGIGPAAKSLPSPNGVGTLGSHPDAKVDRGISASTLPIPIEEARWAARNGCSKSPTTSDVATGVTLIAYSCPGHATVELYRESGDGHIWAGSQAMVAIESVVGKTTFAISADQLMWTFFANHPL
jgi:polyhydroxybutyrate depolymerase